MQAIGTRLVAFPRGFSEQYRIMTRKSLLLIAGRTSKQGCGISEGKHTVGYRAETRTLHVSPDDMLAMTLRDGQLVRVSRVRSDAGPPPGRTVTDAPDDLPPAPSVVLPVETAKGGDPPPGLAFIAYGDISCRLMDSDTHGSGMPTSKGGEIMVETMPENPTEGISTDTIINAG